jgi:hypothetical protein
MTDAPHVAEAFGLEDSDTFTPRKYYVRPGPLKPVSFFFLILIMLPPMNNVGSF